jgi:hypothetical protein
MSMINIGIFSITAVAVMAFLIYLMRRRKALPPYMSHLKPYFKNRAEFDAFVKKEHAENASRKEELIDPVNAGEAAEYLSLNDFDVKNSTFEKALDMVEANLKDDSCEYGQLLGEIYAFSKAYGDPEKAYFYYYIGLSQNGYSVGFRDENHDPPYYCGPVGDFRNEVQVCELVEELGWDKIKQIDLKALEWLTRNNFEVKEFLEEDQDQTKLE